MPPVSSRKLPPKVVEMVLLGEGANQGHAGLEFIADVLFNRATSQGRSLEDVATSPNQFSAYTRPDLAQFYAQQPPLLQDYAAKLVQERRNPNYEPAYRGVEHYVTKSLWNKRRSLGNDHWLNKMKLVQVVGDHVALRPAN